MKVPLNAPQAADTTVCSLQQRFEQAKSRGFQVEGGGWWMGWWEEAGGGAEAARSEAEKAAAEEEKKKETLSDRLFP